MGGNSMRILFHNLYEIGRNESYFSDMSNKGLHLKKITFGFALFEKGIPKEKKYRITIFKDSPTEKIIESYARRGWDFVTKRGKFYIFVSDEYRNKIYGESKEHEDILLKTLRYEQIKNILFIFILTAVAFLCWKRWREYGSLLSIFGIEFIEFSAAALMGFCLFINSVSEIISIYKIKKNLNKNVSEEYKESYKFNTIMKAMFICVIMFLAGTTLYLKYFYEQQLVYENLKDAKISIPIVRLSDIESDDALEPYSNESAEEEADKSNSLKYKWAPFTKVNAEAVETGIVLGREKSKGAGDYTATLITHYYDVSYEKIKEYGLKNEIAECRKINLIDEFKHSKINDTEVFYYESEGRVIVVLQRDSEILSVSYYGEEKLERVITAVLRAFNV